MADTDMLYDEWLERIDRLLEFLFRCNHTAVGGADFPQWFKDGVEPANVVRYLHFRDERYLSPPRRKPDPDDPDDPWLDENDMSQEEDEEDDDGF